MSVSVVSSFSVSAKRSSDRSFNSLSFRGVPSAFAGLFRGTSVVGGGWLFAGLFLTPIFFGDGSGDGPNRMVGAVSESWESGREAMDKGFDDSDLEATRLEHQQTISEGMPYADDCLDMDRNRF